MTDAATHIRKAEELLAEADRDVSENWKSRTGEHKSDILAAAQVHATLAVALGSLGFPGGMPSCGPIRASQGGLPSTLGEAIKEGRTRLGLSQRALAAKMTDLGVAMDATAVTRLENNQREPRLHEGLALSQFLSFDLELLLDADREDSL